MMLFEVASVLLEQYSWKVEKGHKMEEKWLPVLKLSGVHAAFTPR